MPGESAPSDYDLWGQCHVCRTTYPIYEAKLESKLQDFVETTSNPFDQGQNIIGLGNKVKKQDIKNKDKNY